MGDSGISERFFNFFLLNIIGSIDLFFQDFFPANGFRLIVRIFTQNLINEKTLIYIPRFLKSPSITHKM